MTNHAANSISHTLPKPIIKKNETGENWTLWNIGAGIGLLGGTFLLFGTMFLMVTEYFYGEKSHGVWLFLAVLPLWILGAHCLDKGDEAEKAKRIEDCRKNGLRDADCIEQE